jgi:aldose 1-epimerase
MSNLSASKSESATFGKLADGREVRIFTLTNTQGLTARILDYGAILAGLDVPDAAGRMADVALGYDTLPAWLENPPFCGACVGRFGNRIANGRFTLDGKTYELAINSESAGIPCHLHGGSEGFYRRLWSGRLIHRPGAQGVSLTHTSPDGEEGYPGTMQAKVTYWLTDADELIWEAEATTDKATVVNLVNHAYWNLSGDPTKSILDHELMLAADAFLPTNPGMIPTGERAPVAGTPMDFRTPRAIGARIGADFSALKLGGGYDHCWVLRDGPGVRLAAVVKDPASGRTMEVLTDQPGVQFYSGNWLGGIGKGGVPLQPRHGLCLETEGFPDAPNQPSFPSAVLRPGETYRHTLIFRFKR